MGDCAVCGEEIELTLRDVGKGEPVKCPQCGAEYEVDFEQYSSDSYHIGLGPQVSQPTRKPWSEGGD